MRKHLFILTLIVFALAGCSDNPLIPGGDFYTFADRDDDTADDDDTTDDDDTPSLPTDDDDASDDMDEFCQFDADPEDDDCDGIHNDDDHIRVAEDQFWITVGLVDNIVSGSYYLVGHGLEVAENDDDADTDWAQTNFPFDCGDGWCWLTEEAVDNLPVRDDMRLSISDGTYDAIEAAPSEVFDYWSRFGPDYCRTVNDPICWDNEPYTGNEDDFALCLSKTVTSSGEIHLAPSSNCDGTY